MTLAGIPFLQELCPIPGRKFRYDFAIECRGSLVLIEVQGGIWRKGGHTSGVGVTRDAEKLNLATLEGYKVLQVTAEHIKSGQAFIWITKALR